MQKFSNKKFAENFMISVKIDNAEEFWQFVVDRRFPEKFGIRVSKPIQQPYGKEVNLIYIAGVCWHFFQ